MAGDICPAFLRDASICTCTTSTFGLLGLCRPAAGPAILGDKAKAPAVASLSRWQGGRRQYGAERAVDEGDALRPCRSANLPSHSACRRWQAARVRSSEDWPLSESTVPSVSARSSYPAWSRSIRSSAFERPCLHGGAWTLAIAIKIAAIAMMSEAIAMPGNGSESD